MKPQTGTLNTLFICIIRLCVAKALLYMYEQMCEICLIYLSVNLSVLRMTFHSYLPTLRINVMLLIKISIFNFKDIKLKSLYYLYGTYHYVNVWIQFINQGFSWVKLKAMANKI